MKSYINQREEVQNVVITNKCDFLSIDCKRNCTKQTNATL